MRRRELLIHLSLCGTLAAVCPSFAAESAMTTWFVFLEAGRKTPDDKSLVEAMQHGHIANFKRLFKLGRLMAAGPMRDPVGIKRGIVTMRASSFDELLNYFQEDTYVREGYLNVNAVPATAHKAFNTEGIDDTAVEELRIVQIGRGDAMPDDTTVQLRQSLLRDLVDRGSVGAWYTLHTGPVAEVLFARTRDTPALVAAFSPYAGLGSGGVTLAVWAQWLSRGVIT